MKKNIYVFFITNLFIWILPSYSVNLNTERLSNLKCLTGSNIPYDSIAPMDSVIVWGQQPILFTQIYTDPHEEKSMIFAYPYNQTNNIP